MADEAGWSLTESDPGIFSQMLWELGLKGLEVAELWSLDPSLLENLRPYALVFLFKWRDAASTPAQGELRAPSGPHYFARQVINNACATIALLNATLNIQKEPGFELGSELTQLHSFSEELDYETRGHVLTNSEKLRIVHNSFARNDPFSLDDLDHDGQKEDAYHFVSYLPIGDHLYELDGLAPEPKDHGPISGGREAWMEKAREVLEARMASYASGEVGFNLMAIVQDRVVALEEEIGRHQAIMTSVADETAKNDCIGQIARLQADLADEQAKRARWQMENILRRNNLTSLSVALLEELARAGKLQNQVEVAKKTMEVKRQKHGE